MKIALSQIDANPHRDLTRNPPEPDQVQQIIESIGRTGFWDNIVVRESQGRYQLAYGHNRWQALLQLGTIDAEFIVKPLSDYDMLAAMIDENATQRNQTPKIVFENVDAAIRLAERLIGESKNVEDFNRLVKSSMCPTQDTSRNLWSEQQFSQARNCLESGEGLGRGFIAQFLPGKPPGNDTLQAVIDSHYAQSRKAAAEKKAREAAEEAQRREAEAAKARTEAEARVQEEREAKERANAERRARLEAEARVQTARDEKARQKARAETEKRKKAEEAARRQAEARKAEAEKQRKREAVRVKEAQEARKTAVRQQEKAERMDYAGVDRDLLERLGTQSLMQEVVALIKREKIPQAHHAALIQECLDQGWSSRGTAQDSQNHVRNAGRAWWYRESGQMAKDREKARNQHQAEKLRWERDKSLNHFVEETKNKTKDWVKRLDAIKSFADQVEGENLIKAFDAQLGALISVAQAIRENLPREENVVSMNLKRLSND